MKKYLKAYTVFNRDPIFIYYDLAICSYTKELQ